MDINRDLQDNQRKLVMEVLSEFTDVITDRPGNTSVLHENYTVSYMKRINAFKFVY